MRRGAPDDRLGLFPTVAIVVGGIVGTGIFTVPASIADYGWLSVPAFAVVAGGSLALALTFARLVRRTRRSGGPYAYADDAFGQFAGFLAAWTYWIQGGPGMPRSPSPGPATPRRCSGWDRIGSRRSLWLAPCSGFRRSTTSSAPVRWVRWPWPRSS
jgi:hypothetical protein